MNNYNKKNHKQTILKKKTPPYKISDEKLHPSSTFLNPGNTFDREDKYILSHNMTILFYLTGYENIFCKLTSH